MTNGGHMKTPDRIRILLLAFLAGISICSAQSLDQRLNAFGRDYAKGYVQPFIDVTGANLNSGLYHTADVENGLDIYIGVKVMGAFVPSGKETFTIASPYNGVSTSTATIFGGTGSPIPGAPNVSSVPQSYLDGASDFKSMKFVPYVVPQLAVGNIMGTQLMVRFYPSRDLKDIGKFSFFGFGVQHSLSQYIPMLPLNLSAQAVYQAVDLGDNFSAKAYSFGIQASKSLFVVSLYGGLAVESSSFSFAYTYKNPNPGGGSATAEKISMDFTGSNTFRLTIGAVVHLLIFDINADYNIGDISVVSAGIGVSL